jgi:hypothetical protein
VLYDLAEKKVILISAGFDIINIVTSVSSLLAVDLGYTIDLTANRELTDVTIFIISNPADINITKLYSRV